MKLSSEGAVHHLCKWTSRDLVHFFGHEIIDLSNEMDMDLLDHPPQAGSRFLDLVQHRSRPGS